MSQPDTTKELHKILPPANNWVKLTQQGHDELTQQLESYINNKVKEANKDILDALYWMYVQYCGDGHHFMNAGEDASELLEKAGYIKVDSAGRITEDFKELEK